MLAHQPTHLLGVHHNATVAEFGVNTPIAIGFELIANRFHLRNNGRNELARKFAQIAATRPPPRDLLIFDSTVYDWRARDELAFAEYNCGDRRESARLWRALVAEGRLPDAERERIQRNLAALAMTT